MNEHGAKAFFQTTRWSVIRQADGSDQPHDVAARNDFCENYWYPIYAFIRRSGSSSHDAEDLTQAFFARLLEKDILTSADPEKGRLRSFLLRCVQNFLADERDHTLAQKRGARLITSLDAARADERYAAEPVDSMSPDRLFQRRWAHSILEQALAALREEFVSKYKPELFVALRPYLGFAPESQRSQEEIAADFGLPVDTVRSHVRRLRKRWSDIVSELVADTLAEPTPEAIRSELSELLAQV